MTKQHGIHCEALRAIYTHINSVTDARIEIELGAAYIRSGSKNAGELHTRMADQNTAEIPPWLQLGRLQQRIGAVVSMH